MVGVIFTIGLLLYLYYREDKYGTIFVNETDFIKPISDDKSYRVVRLKKGMEVLLISDINTSNSAASLSVGVGSSFDPNEALGLAHFCDHMHFLVI